MYSEDSLILLPVLNTPGASARGLSPFGDYSFCEFKKCCKKYKKGKRCKKCPDR